MKTKEKKTKDNKIKQMKAKIQESSFDRKCSAYGIKNEERNLIPGQLSYYVPQAAYGNENEIRSFVALMSEGGVPYHFFDKKDGEIYSLVNDFFTKKIGSPEMEMAVIDLTRLFNQLRRQVTGKKAKHLKELVFKKANQKKYLIGTGAVLKILAWGVCHAYVTGLFLDKKGIWEVIPKNADPDVVIKWNGYIKDLPDIPDNIKDMFTIGEDGTAKFVTENAYEFAVVSNDGDNEDAAKKHSILDSMAKNAMDRDGDRTPVFVQATEEDKKQILHSFGELVGNPSAPAAPQAQPSNAPGQIIDFNSIPSKEPTKINPVEVIEKGFKSVKTDKDGDPYRVNNTAYGKIISRIKNLTKAVNECGLKVLYSEDKQFKGLTRASIYGKDDKLVRELIVDPLIIYGDTLRIVTMNDPNGDIRNELFVPISQDEILKKAITGTLTDADAIKIRDKFPDCIMDNTRQFHFLDLVDLRNLALKTRTGLPVNDWKKLLENIDKIVTDPRCPVCRWRVKEYVNPNKFTLVVDENVSCAYHGNPVLALQSNADALKYGFEVSFDGTKDPSAVFSHENVQQ